MTGHHEIFSRFAGAEVELDPAFDVDFIGARFRRSFNNVDISHGRANPQSTGPWPGFDEEYFEWIDILDAVENASDAFTIIELGAGFGRWSVRALRGARMRGIATLRAIAVEAEPVHAEWCRQAFADNGFAEGSWRVIEAAVAPAPGARYFYVEAPDKALTAATWYGQALAHPKHAPTRADDRDYAGREVFSKSEWGTIEVEAVALNDLLAGEAAVDIIDMDVQGEELRVIEASIDALNEKVKMLHIGTHSSEIDSGLIKVLRDAGWSNRRTYLSGQFQETPYGVIEFQDGVQTWLNPRLRAATSAW